jgi:hypothetical protein
MKIECSENGYKIVFLVKHQKSELSLAGNPIDQSATNKNWSSTEEPEMILLGGGSSVCTRGGRGTGFTPRSPRGHVATGGRGQIFLIYTGSAGIDIYGFRAGSEFFRGTMEDRQKLSIRVLFLRME